MAAFGLIIAFCLTLAWSGDRVGVQALPVTVMPTDNLSTYITEEEANMVLLDDLTQLHRQLTTTKDAASTSLIHYCGSITADDLPAGITCEEYSEMTGSSHMTCTRPITAPEIHDGIDRTLTTTVLEVKESVEGHNAMIQGLLELPAYSDSSSCSSVSATSPAYFVCQLKKLSVRYNKRTALTLQYMLDDLENDTTLPKVSCEADASNEKMAPLGVLWKIISDFDTHAKNVRTACEHVKIIQNVPEHNCS